MLHNLLFLLLPVALALEQHHVPGPREPSYPVEEEFQEFWKVIGQAELIRQIQMQPIVKQAKNVIFFMGDGMGVSTLTAARILKGQQEGLEGGEQAELSFERFPNLALSKTYCVDRWSIWTPLSYLMLLLQHCGRLCLLCHSLLGRCEGPEVHHR